MRRFSQRTHLVTLSEINITPLLDLAFVLLIIFVITTPLLEQGLPLRLPQGGRPDPDMKREDFHTLELGQGYFLLDQKRIEGLPQLQAVLAREQRANPNVVILVRADSRRPFDDVFHVLDLCANLKLTVSLRSEPPRAP